ncbi:MAG: sugar kinase [Armatimonadetes bacterium]|nr:sugar kinase [Armatimonadota bacterium]
MIQRDVLTFGETMLRLSPPGRLRLDQAAALDVWVAGSESNLAAALCGLGLSATWVSRLPDNPVGRRIEAVLRARGVDVSHVVWAPADERAGLYFFEAAAPPRPATVVYDRAGSAASRLSPAALPDALFDMHRHLHVSGITPALSASCAEAVTDAVRRAKARGRTVSLDINYRAKLWPPEAAAAALSPLLAQADVVFCGREDAARLFGLSGDNEARARGLRSRFDIPVVALTAGADGAVGCDAGGCRAMPAVPVAEPSERLGSGDAFAAGFLAEYLPGAPLERALRLGVAAAALKRTVPGDMLVATRAEVGAIAAQEGESAWR